MRYAFVIGLGVAASSVGVAAADVGARVEASAFVGFDTYSSNSQLGNSWAPEQVPSTAPSFGVRVLGLLVPRLVELADGRVGLALAVEGELGCATAYTGGSYDGGRGSYFAPVFDWRAHVLLRLRADALGAIRPHLVIGGGGETVVSSSPFMSKESDPEVYWGLGASVPVTARWQLRLDGRHGVMPGRSGLTSTFAVQLGMGAAFGDGAHARVRPPDTRPPDERTPDTRPPDTRPPDIEPPVVVDPDPDNDGIVGDADHCPDAAEDFDHFQDDDGCPEPDNDNDGFIDARDACPNEPETYNGIDDDDGCPDVVPAPIAKALAAASALRFEPGRARVTPEHKRILAPLVKSLGEREALRVAIVVHAERAGTAASDLATRRAEAIKWYLADRGTVADRMTAAAGDPVASARAPLVELALIPLPRPTPPSP